ncbi:MAG: hypothetical protein WAK34_17635, partial [Rhodoplanes sp.]
VARSLGLAQGTVSKYVNRTRRAGQANPPSAALPIKFTRRLPTHAKACAASATGRIEGFLARSRDLIVIAFEADPDVAIMCLVGAELGDIRNEQTFGTKRF